MLILDDIVQGSPEWFAEKLGKPSSSKLDKMITPTGTPSKSRQGYMYELAAEVIRGKAVESYQSQAMADGILKEEDSRKMYEFINNVEVEQVGMIYPDEQKLYLASPDGLINRQRGLEMKNVLPKTQIFYLLNPKELIKEYFIQVQTCLLVSGFDRWDLMSNCDGLPPLILVVERDEVFISKLKTELEKFTCELAATVKKLREL